MKYKFSVEPRGSWLHVRVAGDNTSENVRRYLGEILVASTAHQCRRVLVEEHLIGPSLGTMEMFSLVSQGSAQADAISAIAYVDTNPEHDKHLLRFAESVALNRGVQMKMFATVEQAVAWLEASAPGAVTP